MSPSKWTVAVMLRHYAKGVAAALNTVEGRQAYNEAMRGAGV